VQKEIVIKKVPLPQVVFYIITLILVAAAVEKFWHNRYIIGSVLVIIGAAFLYTSKWEPRKAQALIKISDDRLWTRNRGNKPWQAIICIKFRFEGQHNVYMDIYRSNEVVADEELNLHGINMSIWKLKRILRKYVRVENH
jgi:general stress protein CsbA